MARKSIDAHAHLGNLEFEPGGFEMRIFQDNQVRDYSGGKKTVRPELVEG